MSGYADTIRVVLDWPITHWDPEERLAAVAALVALLAENQRLRAFAEWVLILEQDRTNPALLGLVIDNAREALAGGGELEPLDDPTHLNKWGG